MQDDVCEKLKKMLPLHNLFLIAMKQVTYEGLTFQPYISKEEIAARVEEIGQQIMRDCAYKMPMFVCLINGAFHFASYLFIAVDGLYA